MTDPEASQSSKNDGSSQESVVVVLGGSAGAVDALQDVFSGLPETEDVALVVTVHQPETHESALLDVLETMTQMSVRILDRPTPIEGGFVYVVPPAHVVHLDDDTRLVATLPEDEQTKRAPIDRIFRNLSGLQERLVAVVLSGTGADGAVGIRSVKEKGGVVIAQDPSGAKYEGMPRSAVETNMTDFVVPATEVGQRILRHRDVLARIGSPGTVEEEASDEVLQKIFTQLRVRTGNDFSHYKRSTMLRRIGRRMQVNQKTSLNDYLAYLRQSNEEAQALLKDLLITVTNFFRDPDAFDVLRDEVVPGLFEGKGHDDQVRVWVAGCATGEEAYSVAMMLIEHAMQRDVMPEVQVFATDLDEDALATAREGRYPESIAGDISTERLNRFFLKDGTSYLVSRQLRDHVLFSPHNLLKDPPFSKLDLVTCRNLLIYLKRDMQTSVFRLFHYVLREDGYLFLGSSESVDAAEGFTPINNAHRIFRRVDLADAGENLPSLPFTTVRTGASISQYKPPTPGEPSFNTPLEGHARLLETSAPPSIVVNAEYQMVHLSESAGRYLQHPGGSPSRDVLDHVRAELQSDLLDALKNVFEHGRATATRPRSVAFNGDTRLVSLIVQPSTSDVETQALILFAEVDDVQGGGPTTNAGDEVNAEGGEAEASDAETVQHLKKELRNTRARLRATVEKHETSKEEMRAANEELRSINEEYKSTAEELETSKEELQSVNEELQTVNAELEHKVEELSRSNSDLENLLASTDIGTLFLDRELKIQRYTPRIEELFRIRQQDRGRPIGDLTNRIDYDGLQEDARKVLNDLVPIENEVQGAGDTWYLVRLRPYRTADDRIDGVVITFIDITDRRRAEDKLREINETLEERVAEQTRRVRSISESLAVAEEQERKRIAQLLHDDLQQTLYGIEMALDHLRHAIEDENEDTPTLLADEIKEKVDEAIETTRSLSADLSPTVVKETSMRSVLHWLADRMSDDYGLEVDVRTEGPVEIEERDVRVFLYRLVRELLFNVEKHADVSSARVEARRTGDTITVAVEDDGSGFDPSVMEREDIAATGIGLTSIPGRVEALGGSFTLETATGEGTRIVISVPV